MNEPKKSREPSVPSKNNFVRIASIDIGRCNFAQYVEDFSSTEIVKLEERYKKLPKKLKRRVRGKTNPEIEKLLEDTVLCGTRVQTGVYDFTGEKEKNSEECDEYDLDEKNVETGLTMQIRLNLLEHLNKYRYLWDTCDIFVIEQQFFNSPTFNKKGTGRKAGSFANVNAIKMAEAVFVWFLDKYRTSKIITYFGSQFKTQILGAPWKMTKPERKKWAIEKSYEIYTKRGDEDMINIYNLSEAVKRKRINSEARIQKFKDEFPCETEDAQELADKIIREKQKLDDCYGDAFLQAQAFKFRTMVACF